MLPKTGATRPVAGTRARRHVATHRARRHRETELHAKFGRDALLTPRAIRGGHLDDEASEATRVELSMRGAGLAFDIGREPVCAGTSSQPRVARVIAKSIATAARGQ